MEYANSFELILKFKEIKKKTGLSYRDICKEIERRGKFVSMSSIRRVFKEGSEMNASSFSYDHTLLPIAEVLFSDEDALVDPEPFEGEVDNLKTIIHVQDEEIGNLHDLIDHMESSVAFLKSQIDELNKIIKRLLEIKQ